MAPKWRLLTWIRLDLPLPVRPTTPSFSPLATLNDTSSSTNGRPGRYRMSTCCSSSAPSFGGQAAAPHLRMGRPLAPSLPSEPTYLCRSILVCKRLKLRLSGSVRNSQTRFQDTPWFKFPAVCVRIEPFQRSNECSERGDHPV